MHLRHLKYNIFLENVCRNKFIPQNQIPPMQRYHKAMKISSIKQLRDVCSTLSKYILTVEKKNQILIFAFFLDMVTDQNLQLISLKYQANLCHQHNNSTCLCVLQQCISKEEILKIESRETQFPNVNTNQSITKKLVWYNFTREITERRQDKIQQ